MEITLEAIISLVGLITGGGAGAFFTWKWQQRKAKAEAETAEVDAAKELQDVYQQMMQDLRQDRDHYKNDRNELRDRLDKMDEKMRDLQLEVARNGRQIDMMRPFICTDLSCKLRKRGKILDIEATKVKHNKKNQGTAAVGTCTEDIEPYNGD